MAPFHGDDGGQSFALFDQFAVACAGSRGVREVHCGLGAFAFVQQVGLCVCVQTDGWRFQTASLWQIVAGFVLFCFFCKVCCANLQFLLGRRRQTASAQDCSSRPHKRLPALLSASCRQFYRHLSSFRHLTFFVFSVTPSELWY